MSKPDYTDKLDAFLNEVWSKREEGLPAPEIDWNRPVRHQDLLYVLNKYPFLQIVNTEPDFLKDTAAQLVKAQSGWVIHVYGDAAMSSSPGNYLFGPGNPDLKEEEEGGGGTTGTGTIVKQAFDTAQAMILLAMEKHWPGVHIAAGTPIMQWAAWMAAQDHGYQLEGYEPSEQDQQKRKRILSLLSGYEKELRSTPSFRR